MTDFPDIGLDEAAAYRKLLRECERFFRSCATQFADQCPDRLQESADAFIGRMLEVHRGLVVKVFIEIAKADHRVSQRERKLAVELFDHCWGRRLNEEQLTEALDHCTDSAQPHWDGLLWPFARLSTFRARLAELFALVQRMALAVASANKRVDARILETLHWIISEMQTATVPVPLAVEDILVPSPRPGKRSATEQQVESAGRARSYPPPSRERPGPAHDDALTEVLAELESLIGLESIKKQMRELVDFLKMQEERKKFNLPQTPITLHAVFTGNPGTGKTTVARLLGRILGALGILTRGHLLETDRSGLVAEYAGQTGPKTNQRIDEALDGVLFIDEAYSLVADSGDDPYGTEALQTLLKRMEDERNRLVIVVAGYPEPMDELLRVNPGFSSRFGLFTAFPDYSASELGRIFSTFCQRDRYELSSRMRAKLLLGFQNLLDHRDKQFGNGRLARTVFERSVRRLAGRLAPVKSLTRSMLTTLQAEDLVMEGVPGSIWDGLETDKRVFYLLCPQCKRDCHLPQLLLGTNVACRHCEHKFVAEWAEVKR
jgi:ATPase family associated with various cellular activities (AAA)/AAA lid domain